ncbi:MAG: PstS family phosphate ABC transporter substrate-binding protein [Rhodospirillum sp.]|nr:PstS family phosphate ABC transporter substrate-binding protein [Rhodospirillum sp.]MCF8489318.1 PstS family phosphate ABC transporter substrate-binding protein [Rhodospirillum sp.]MCF8502397.1 PstS family phosphate ABC transporter substrate-binding protein [Rhodospirillum sp.]
MIKKTLTLAALAVVATAGAAEARDQIRIVGSSTVYPFSTTVAENFGKTTDFKTPVIESTGSGGGLKLFCAGVGTEHPDMTNSSRRIKKSEVETCAKNGVTDITEVKIGFDGIVLANGKNAPLFNLNKGQIFQALAKEVPVDGKWVANPYKSWSDIDASLPAEEIEVLGPPPTSGTRDAFVELVMEEGCLELPACAELKKADADKFKQVFGSMREDGAFIEAGENDNLIVQKLDANPLALGIFGFSFLDQNSDKIQGSNIEGVSPTFEAIASGEYKVSRPLFFYIKDAHVGTIPGIKEYVAEFTADKAWGPEGYLADKGLIPLPDDMRAEMAKQAADLAPLSL